MRKKVLFVMGAARAGGTITSLLNLLSLLDPKKVEAHLFLQNHVGVLYERTKEFALLPEDITISSVLCTKTELKKKGLRAYMIRLSFIIWHRLFGVKRANAHFYKKSAKKLSGKYDVVVAYQEGAIADYVRYIEAPRHVAWCHMDYKAFAEGGVNILDDWRDVYARFDDIACVSTVVLESMINDIKYPTDHISVVYNTIPPEYIRSRAEESKNNIKKAALTLVSSGRYVSRKRFDRFVLAAETLKKKGIEFIWYFLGEGEGYIEISKMIKQKGLLDCVVQVGSVENPFVYYKASDVFVMASENEGQPMVLNEAMTLGIPVITTEFPSAREAVDDGICGMIVPNSDTGLVEGVLSFATDPALQMRLKDGALNFRYRNDEILRNVYSLLDVGEINNG